MLVNKKYLFGKTQINQMKLSPMVPKGITVHNTANTATAHNEAANVYNNNTKKGASGAAVHYFIDEDSIYQNVPDNISGWHASDGGQGFGNRQTISIEICRSNDYKSNKYARAEVNAAVFIKNLMERYNIPTSKVLRHYDYAKNKKKCPHRMFESNPRNWTEFKSLITGSMPTNPKPITKDITQVAREVISGKWGNGNERITKLTQAGYKPTEIQKAVNILVNTKAPTKKTVDEVAYEVVAGKWGNMPQRKVKIESAGYSYNDVQWKVNQILSR